MTIITSDMDITEAKKKKGPPAFDACVDKMIDDKKFKPSAKYMKMKDEDGKKHSKLEIRSRAAKAVCVAMFKKTMKKDKL